MAKVTAVIPCYNHGQFVDRAVSSVLAQGVEDVAIYIVDDGSNDPETIKILDEYPTARATVLRKKNGHLSSARNHGIERATGDYILLLDADDYFAPTFLKQAIAILDADNSAGAVTCLTQNFGLRTDLASVKTGGALKDFLTANPCNASCLFRKQCWVDVGGFDETMKEGYEDWNFWIAVTRKGWLVRSIPEHLFHYFVARESMVVESDKKRPKLMRRLVENHLEAYQEHVDLVVHEKEMEIQQLQRKLDELRGSTTFRLGRCLTDPLGILGGLFNRLRKK
jgi:glycosyltransferase involved in cell wall biosynthesis